MKRFFLSFVILISSMFLSVSVYAIDAPANLRVASVGDDSFTLEWDNVSGAVGYYHYLGTSSQNYKDGIELIEGTQKLIENIDMNKKYYVSITAVDNSGIESEYSQEFVFNSKTLNEDSNDSVFRIKEIKVVDQSTLELEFSKELNTESSSERLFRLEQKSNGKEYPIVLSEVSSDDSKKIIAILEEPLMTNTKYEFTVLNIESRGGDTIESGIDAFIAFDTPESFDISVPNEELPSAGLEENIEDTTPNVEDTTPKTEEAPLSEVSSTQTQTPSQSEQDIDISGMGGKTISVAETQTSLQKATEGNESLPQTGPREWMLLIFALILGALGIFFFRNKVRV